MHSHYRPKEWPRATLLRLSRLAAAPGSSPAQETRFARAAPLLLLVSLFGLGSFAAYGQPAAPAPAQSATQATRSPAPASSAESSPSPEARQQPARGAATAKEKRAAERLYLAGAKALERQDLHAALDQFTRAATLNPENQDYVAAEQIARAHLVTSLVQEADKARILDQPALARARLAEAFTLDSNSPIVAQHVDDLANLSLHTPEKDDPAAEIANTVELTPAAGKHSFHLRGTGETILRQVLAAYGITPALDASVRVMSVRFDADDVDYTQAAEMLRLATNTFFVPLDPKRVLVAKDTKDNRQKFQRMLLETVYLPGLSPTEMSDIGNLARNVFDAQQATVQPGFRTLTVRAPENRLAALNHTLYDLLDGRSELLLDVRLIEVARTRTRNTGVQLPQQFTAFNIPSELNSVINNNQSLIQQIVSSGLAPAGDTAAIVAILIASGQVSSSILNQPFATFGGGLTYTGLTLGTTQGNLALNSSDTRSLDNVQLRVQDLDTATIMAGSHYPIIQSSYSNVSGVGSSIAGLNTAGLSSQLAALGLNASSLTQQAIPQVQYEDLGLTLKATPHVLRTHAVALKLDFKLQALAGSSLNSIPVLTNRQFTASIDVPDGESTLVTSAISRSESRAISGVPGLSELPGFGAPTDISTDLNTDDLIVLVTPHIIRRTHENVAGAVVGLPPHD